MKMKILLSVEMLILSCSVYADEIISMELIRYAMQNPGTPIVITDSIYTKYSADWLWETEYTTKQMIIYYGEDCRFSSPFNQTIASSQRFCWWIMVYVVFGIIGSFFIWWTGYVIGFPTFAFLHITFDNEYVYWWIPVITIVLFFGAAVFGRYVRQKNKKFKEEKLWKIRCF